MEEVITGTGHLNAGTSGEGLWKLSVFGSGSIRLQTINGGIGEDNYNDEEFWCNKDVFVVKTPTWSGSKDWESSVRKIVLTLENCQSDQDNGKKEICNLKISEEVGLAWNPKFNPQVTLLS